MSRARNIKPSFFKNEILAECHPLARILFEGLWTLADRAGRLEDRPKKIRAEVLPYDDCDPDDLLNQLEQRNFIRRYQVGENKYIQVVTFEKHQNPHVKEPASLLPAPDEHHTSPVLNVPLPESPIPYPESPILNPSTPDPVQAPVVVVEKFILPDWVPVDPWNALMEVRKKKRDAQTPYALNLIVGKLQRISAIGHDPTDLLNEAVERSWSTVFEPKGKFNAKPTTEPKSTSTLRSAHDAIALRKAEIARQTEASSH